MPRPGAGDQDIADWAEEVRIGVIMIVMNDDAMMMMMMMMVLMILMLVMMMMMMTILMQVRPSMRKLRQGMDSLLKTSRMMCSVFRLEQSPEAVKLTAEVGNIDRTGLAKQHLFKLWSR